MSPLRSNKKASLRGKEQSKICLHIFPTSSKTFSRAKENVKDFFVTKPRKDVAATAEANPAKAWQAAVKSDREPR